MKWIGDQTFNGATLTVTGNLVTTGTTRIKLYIKTL